MHNLKTNSRNIVENVKNTEYRQRKNLISQRRKALMDGEEGRRILHATVEGCMENCTSSGIEWRPLDGRMKANARKTHSGEVYE